VAEGLERGVRPLAERIETFKMLVERLSKGAVVWRFDPLILTDQIDMDKLLRKIENIGDQLKDYTEKLVFSFADIVSYRKVKANLERNQIKYIDWTKEQMIEFARRLVKLNQNKGWNFTLATCGEAENLDGVEHNHCVDDRLIIRFGYKSPELIKFLGAEFCQASLFEPAPDDAIELPDGRFIEIKKNNRDKGQRIACGCMKSKDIGEYNTCPHLCEYCYANASKEVAIANFRVHKSNQYADTITGR
jgi:hypothetical protein